MAISDSLDRTYVLDRGLRRLALLAITYFCGQQSSQTRVTFPDISIVTMLTEMAKFQMHNGDDYNNRQNVPRTATPVRDIRYPNLVIGKDDKHEPAACSTI